MNFKYKVKIAKQQGGYIAEFIDLPNIFTEGNTLDEVLFNAKDALEETLHVLLDESLDFAKPSTDLLAKEKGMYLIEPKPVLQVALLIKFSDKKISEIARDMGTSWGNVQKLLKPGANPTLKQIEKLANSVGKNLSLTW